MVVWSASVVVVTDPPLTLTDRVTPNHYTTPEDLTCHSCSFLFA